MQISSTPTATTARGTVNLATMRIGHAMNGIHYTEHQIVAPDHEPIATFSGSLQDAIAGATALIRDLETRADGRVAVALLGLPGTWTAHTITADGNVLRAIDHGPGTGGIASISFPMMSRSLAALVTSTGSLLPAQLR